MFFVMVVESFIFLAEHVPAPNATSAEPELSAPKQP